MPAFLYQGRSRQGKDVQGELEAADEQAARRLLRQRQIVVTRVKKKGKQLKLSFGSGVGMADVTNFARQFAVMIGAGMPLIQSMNILTEQSENPAFQAILRQVTADVEGGGTIAEALAKHPKVFDELFVNMVAAGQVGGILDTILVRLSGYLESAEELKRKVKGAMLMPVIIMVVAGLCTCALLFFVIPIFVRMFEEAHAKLPAPTLIVVAASKALQKYWYLFLGGGIGAFVGYKKVYATPKGRLMLDAFQLKAPVIGDLARKTAVARFARTLGTLLDSGVPVLEALDIAAKTAGNRVVQDAIRSMMGSIAAGESMTEPMKKSGVFPAMVIQMVNVGQEAGNLPAMLNKVGDFYDVEVDASVEALTTAIEPIVMVFLAVVVGGMIMAMYLPIFDMMNAVSGAG